MIVLVVFTLNCTAKGAVWRAFKCLLTYFRFVGGFPQRIEFTEFSKYSALKKSGVKGKLGPTKET